MEISSLFHKTDSNMAYAYDEHTLHIKLQTKMNDVQKVSLVFGDPYDYRENRISENSAENSWEWHSDYISMRKTGSNGIHDYWLIEVKPERKRIRYAFYLESDGSSYLYGERKTMQVTGFEDPELCNPFNFFAFPFINAIDVYKAPNWTKDAIWYQIFPERFANGDESNDPIDVKAWNEPITSSGHYGGDLQGVIDHLDYLEELGINAIYFTPIFQSKSNHKYDTIDYLTVDPHFGDKELLKKLVDKAHERGIKVMLDVVFNHSGFYFDKFQDVVEKGADSAYKDWFHIKKFPVYDKNEPLKVSTELNFDTFAFTASMPKLNTENIETKEYLLNIIRYWSDAVEIDGWRLDVANEVDHQFWREFRAVVKAKNPQAFILGEVWHDANPWLKGDQFDAVMNYPLNEAVLGFFAKDDFDSLYFANEVMRTNFSYPKHVNENMYNLLDSHDTPRFLNQAGENKDRLKLAYVFMMTQAGAPSVYYGNEVGMTGGHDPDCRRTMVWDEEKQDIEILDFIKRLIRIRKDHVILRHQGDLCFLQAGLNPDVLLYKRYHEKELYYILINRSESKQIYQLPEEMWNRTFDNLWLNEPIRLSVSMELEPYSFFILKAENE